MTNTIAYPESLRSRSARIRVAIFDVDGVLTDGRLYYTAMGEDIKVFHVHDGHGLVTLRQQGIRTAIISGRKSPALDRRLADLAFDFIFTGCGQDKTKAFAELLKQAQVDPSQCSMMGDDLPDLPLFQACALAFAPANAMPIIRAKADYVTQAQGGMGAVREVCDLLLMAYPTTAH